MESTQPNSSSPDPMLSRTLGSYRIVRKIAAGGMGVVYEAFDDELHRRAAVKVLLPELLNSADAANRFFNEAKAVSQVTHKSLVSIFAHGTGVHGEAYIVMEYLDGDSLRQRLEKRYLGGSAIGITIQLAAGLAATHENRIIHRDLKPENIILVADEERVGAERAKIVDFGIAKLLPSSAMETDKPSFKTRTGTLIGTPTYMSPEQCRASSSEPADEKTDVYALGVILYEMLYGEPPFTSESAGELFALQMFAPPPPINERVPELHLAVADLVHRLLAKKAASRPTMSELLRELQALPDSGLQDGPLAARPCVQVQLEKTARIGAVTDPTTSGIIRHQLHIITGNSGHEGYKQTPLPAPPVRRSLLPIAWSGGFVLLCMVVLLVTLYARRKVSPAVGSAVVSPAVGPSVLIPELAAPPLQDAGAPLGTVDQGSAVVGGREPAAADQSREPKGSPVPAAEPSDSKSGREPRRLGSRKTGGRDSKNQKFQIDVWK